MAYLRYQPYESVLGYREQAHQLSKPCQLTKKLPVAHKELVSEAVGGTYPDKY